MFLKITNPETNRKIQINTRLGRRIIRNYINRLSGGAGQMPASTEALAE